MAVAIVVMVITKYKELHERYEKKKKNAHLENKIKGWHKMARVKKEEIKCKERKRM